jgi:CHAT domain-containing protein
MAAKTNRRIALLAERHTDEQASAIDEENKDLLRQYQAVEDEIRVSSPAYAALTQPKPILAAEIQHKVLDANTLLLEYALGGEHSYVFAVTPTSLTAYELPKKVDIEAAARPVYDMLAARSRSQKGETAAQRVLRLQNAEAQYPEAASRLSRMILGPVAPLMAGKRLLIVSDGVLEYVPFAALPPPEPAVQSARFTPLVVNHEIVNLPSASVLQVLRQQSAGRTRPAKAVAVVADPVFQGSDSRVKSPHAAMAATGGGSRKSPETAERSASDSDRLLRSASEVGGLDGQVRFARLLFSRKEANAILKEAPPGGVMKALDFKANLVTVASPVLSQYRIVHFATHGLLNSRHPELSGLVLSLVDEHGRARPGFLALGAIYNLTLPADLVVLSACETGLGKEIQGEGLVGITRGFMYAGATRVMASLWKVNDAATADLMEKFYKGIFKDGLQPAAALRRAQVEMWQHTRWSLPYYWAGFVMQGEP